MFEGGEGGKGGGKRGKLLRYWRRLAMKVWVLLREKQWLICAKWRRGDGCMNGGGIHLLTRDDVSVFPRAWEKAGVL